MTSREVTTYPVDFSQLTESVFKLENEWNNLTDNERCVLSGAIESYGDESCCPTDSGYAKPTLSCSIAKALKKISETRASQSEDSSG